MRPKLQKALKSPEETLRQYEKALRQHEKALGSREEARVAVEMAFIAFRDAEATVEKMRASVVELERERLTAHSSEDAAAKDEALKREHTNFAVAKAEVDTLRRDIERLRARDAEQEASFMSLAAVHAALRLNPALVARPVMMLSRNARPDVQTVLDTATRKLGSIPAWVPRRICEEEIGDALEQVHRFARERAPGWEKRIRAKVLSARFWVLMHAVREIVASALGRKGA